MLDITQCIEYKVGVHLSPQYSQAEECEILSQIDFFLDQAVEINRNENDSQSQQ
jgi:hypothetical protein